MHRLVVDPVSPEPRAIAQAADLIRRGGIVALPTDTLYGLAADPCRPDAVARIFALKGRPAQRALPLIAADKAQVERLVGPLAPVARRLAERFWPGPLTLLFEAPASLVPEVAGGTGRVGVRVPAHEVARALCRVCDRTLTATSANVSGQPALANPDDVARAVGDRVGLLLDAGPAPGGPPSTIVDASGADVRLVRAGAIVWDEVLACVGRA